MMKRILAFLTAVLMIAATALAEENLPELPDQSTMAYMDLTVEAGHTYDVYTGPGTQYLRDDGLTMSADSPYQVIDIYESWLLAEFRAQNGQLCIAWFKPEQIDNVLDYSGMEVLEGECVDGVLCVNSSFTDDPLESCHTSAVVPEGTQIQVLGWLGPEREWLYVRTLNSDTMTMGFICQEDAVYNGIYDSDEAETISVALFDGSLTEARAVNKAAYNDFFSFPEDANANYTFDQALAMAMKALCEQYGLSQKNLLANDFEYGYDLNPDNDWQEGACWQFDFCTSDQYMGQYSVMISDVDGSIIYLCGPFEGNG